MSCPESGILVSNLMQKSSIEHFLVFKYNQIPNLCMYSNICFSSNYEELTTMKHTYVCMYVWLGKHKCELFIQSSTQYVHTYNHNFFKFTD